MIRSTLLAAAFAAVLSLAPAAQAAEASKPAAHRLVIQVSDGDAARWNLAINNLQNVQADVGKDKVDLELVAYGPGIGMLKVESTVGPRISDLVKSGVRVVACENTMTKQKLTKADMLPGIDYVPAGVVELMEKQQQGWAYVRP